jgi:DNA-binding MarR family transcriptional regulator
MSTAMDSTYFDLKRVHLAILARQRAALAPFDITPARLELLQVVRDHPNGFVRQMALGRILAVSAPTVSRMLRSIVELGLVRRRRLAHDPRRKAVELTPLGLDLVRRVEESRAAALAISPARPMGPERSTCDAGPRASAGTSSPAYFPARSRAPSSRSPPRPANRRARAA